MTDRAQLPEPGDLIAAKYRIDRVLGMGGMGAVYEATHRVTGKRFALKVLLPELTTREDVVKRFVREAQVAGRFQHPNVVEVYDIGEHAASYFMVMELLQGESLAARLEREHTLAVDVACKLAIECLDGVAAAHAAGIIHRDLKPANIFLCETRRRDFISKVLDFGISKLSEAPGLSKSTTTDTGTVMGTPFYMAPEQLRSRGVDHRVDIYALGVTLYQTLSGQTPFVADNYPDLVMKIWTETPPRLSTIAPGVPEGLADVVAKAIARSSEDRYGSADEMARAIAAFVSDPSYRVAHEPPQRAAPVAPMRPGAASLHVTQRVDDSGLVLEPAVRARYVASPLPAAGTKPERSPSKLEPPRRSAQPHRAMETTLRTATPLVSESIGSSPIHQGGVLQKPALRWTVVAAVFALAAYGLWRGFAVSDDVASAPHESSLHAASRPSNPTPQVAGAPFEAAPASGAPPSAAARPSVAESTEARVPAPSKDIPPQDSRAAAANARAEGSPESSATPAKQSPPAPSIRPKRVLHDDEPRVGEAPVRLAPPAAEPAPVEPPRADVADAPRGVPAAPDSDARSTPVRRPKPAMDRTQF